MEEKKDLTSRTELEFEKRAPSADNPTAQESSAPDVKEESVEETGVEAANEADADSYTGEGENPENALTDGADAVCEYKPKNKYERVLYRVYKDETLSEMLKISSYAIVALTVYSFIMQIVKLIDVGIIPIIELLIITGVPFVAVSVMRSLFNAPRPYELLEFYEKKPKDRIGKSFPSRHVFSTLAIAVALIPYNAVLGVTLVVLGAVLGAIRVLLGMHFIRDVVAGALIGLISSSLGLLILHLI